MDVQSGVNETPTQKCGPERDTAIFSHANQPITRLKYNNKERDWSFLKISVLCKHFNRMGLIWNAQFSVLESIFTFHLTVTARMCSFLFGV